MEVRTGPQRYRRGTAEVQQRRAVFGEGMDSHFRIMPRTTLLAAISSTGL